MKALQRRGPDTSTAAALLQLQDPRFESSASPSSAYNQYRQGTIDAMSPDSSQSLNRLPPIQNYNAHFPNLQYHSPQSQDQSHYAPAPPLKRKRGNFELHVEKQIDVVGRGLIQEADAALYFQTFFRGCVSIAHHKVDRTQAHKRGGQIRAHLRSNLRHHAKRASTMFHAVRHDLRRRLSS